jgi:hypothetical protein
MPRRKKYAQYSARGCKICGDSSVGRGIAKHLEGAHKVTLAAYKTCFSSGKIIVDKLEESGTAAQGTKRVMVHVLVRRFTVAS